MWCRRFVVVSLLAASLFVYLTAAVADRWWSHVTFLADDRLEGRDTGSAGHRRRPGLLVGDAGRGLRRR